jgi:hypothetical protein
VPFDPLLDVGHVHHALDEVPGVRISAVSNQPGSTGSSMSAIVIARPQRTAIEVLRALVVDEVAVPVVEPAWTSA